VLVQRVVLVCLQQRGAISGALEGNLQYVTDRGPGAVRHHGNAVGHEDRFVDVVRDQHDRLAVITPDALDLVLQGGYRTQHRGDAARGGEDQWSEARGQRRVVKDAWSKTRGSTRVAFCDQRVVADVWSDASGVSSWIFVSRQTLQMPKFDESLDWGCGAPSESNEISHQEQTSVLPER
jgi:hypothetical protein